MRTITRSWFVAPVALLLSLVSVSPAVGQERETVRVAGLTQPVEIIRDTWGIPHIYAQNEADLFFAQGYNAARDRLFQFEIWRRQATGTVAEMLGPRELDRDIATRLFLFRGDMTQEMNHYHPHGELIITSFVRGVNAYIEETERNPDLLPLEFGLLGIRPGRWTPEVVISRHQGLIGNILNELDTGRAVALIGPDEVGRIGYFEPRTPNLQLDPSITAEMLQKDILGLYRTYRRSISFEPSDVVAQSRGELDAYNRLVNAIPIESELAKKGEMIGSNNWFVSGALTASGRPIMVNDPHRAITAPALRYWAHLVAPGWNVIGGGEPVLPGISIGHNEYGAWGLTVFSVDSEDLYVYDINPTNPDQYRYRGGWETMETIRETIPVKGQQPHTAELKFTRHGPVVFVDRELHKAYAVRAAWMDIGAAPYLASLRMNQARNWEEFRQACTYSHIPGENMIWVDIHGDVGWQAVGVSPVRRGWSGLVPVPGDGRYEWDGYLPISDMPHIVNPESGFWGNGNDFVVPRDYPHWDAISFGGWNVPYRGDRVREMLSTGRKLTVADMMVFQHDELSIPARSLVPLLLELNATNDRARRAIDRMRGWDYVLDKRSVPAGIYVEWEQRIMENMNRVIVPEAARELIGVSIKNAIDWIIAPDGRFGRDPVAGRNELLVRSLDEALDGLTQRLGANMDRWQYGQPNYKHALHQHPMSAAVSPQVRERLEVGTLPRGGNSYTVNNTGGSDNQTSGPSFRLIATVEDWDLSVGTLTPGQSGDPDSPFYRNLFGLWGTNQYFPVFYSRAKVESVAHDVTLLTPN